ncbi:MAG: S8 family serine peptidase, partial [Bacteroidota bacterium]
VAQGTGVVSANGGTVSGYVLANGTSLSTPLAAGSAALILSAHPYLTPMQVREAMIQTAAHTDDTVAVWPNNFYGHGMVDALEAAMYHGTVFSNLPEVVGTDSTLSISTFIRSKTPIVPDSVFLYYQAGPAEMLVRVSMVATMNPDQYAATISKGADSSYPRGYVSAYNSTDGARTSPFNAPDSTIPFGTHVTVGPPPSVPEQFVLEQNYPNPFNGATTIRFIAAAAGPVELSLYSVLGQNIRTLFSGTAVPGPNTVIWDGLDAAGVRVSSGVYFYRLTSPDMRLTRKLVFLQ